MAEKGVQTIDRSLDIIELLSVQKDGMGVTEIAQNVCLHKSTVHRLLNALARRGYIEKDPKTGNYKVGLKFIEVGSLYLNQLELKTEALTFLRRLAEKTGQPVHLAILDDTDAVYIEKVDVLNSIRMYSQIGKRVPVYCTAIGKVLLCGMDNKDLYQFVDKLNFYKYTDNSITSKQELISQVNRARLEGWAVDDEEYEHGIRCIAAPVYDYRARVIAAVSTSGDKNILCSKNDAQTVKYVKEAAADISRRMGYFKGNT